MDFKLNFPNCERPNKKSVFNHERLKGKEKTIYKCSYNDIN